tara:strand:- start:3304 stop:4089 length:786 start_codon:yes stop_codon:yes gene_type:complete
MEYKKIKGVKHYIFDGLDEFDEFFKDKEDKPNVFFDWRTAEEGSWVMSDDSRIIQILKKSDINHPNDRRNYKYVKSYIRTVVGTFLCLPKTHMDTDFSKHPNRYTFSKNIKDTTRQVYNREKPTKKEKIFATNIAVGMGAVKSYMDAFTEADSYKAEKKAAILLRQERVMKEVEKSVVDVAKSMGVDHEYVITKLKCLADTAMEDNIVLNAVKELGKAIGTIGNTTIKQKETGVIGLFQGFQPDQLESIKRPELTEAKKGD